MLGWGEEERVFCIDFWSPLVTSWVSESVLGPACIALYMSLYIYSKFLGYRIYLSLYVEWNAIWRLRAPWLQGKSGIMVQGGTIIIIDILESRRGNTIYILCDAFISIAVPGHYHLPWVDCTTSHTTGFLQQLNRQCPGIALIFYIYMHVHVHESLLYCYKCNAAEIWLAFFSFFWICLAK